MTPIPIFTRMNRQAAITILCKPQHNEAGKRTNSREQDHPVKEEQITQAHHYTSQSRRVIHCETTQIFPQREKSTDSNYNVIIQKLNHRIIIYQLLS